MTDTYVRTIVEIQNRSGDPPEDWTVHTVWHHHTDVGGVAGPFDPAGHALNVTNVFQHGTGAGTHPFSYYSDRGITAKVYNMGDNKPRPLLATHTITPGTWGVAPMAPREIAMPLRYYATRNLKSLRGRLYIGPFEMAEIQENVTATPALYLLDLAIALAAIGGVNMSWCMHSPKEDVLDTHPSPGGTTPAAWHDITYAWVNDQWAHMESREHVELSRWHTSITPGIP